MRLWPMNAILMASVLLHFLALFVLDLALPAVVVGLVTVVVIATLLGLLRLAVIHGQAHGIDAQCAQFAPGLPEQFLFRHSQAGHQQQFRPFLGEYGGMGAVSIIT